MSNEKEPMQAAEAEKEMLKEIINIYRKAAAESITGIIKSQIIIQEPKIQQIRLEEVEYALLEPALLAKNCLTSKATGTMMLIFRERDIQIFLNKLMGIDELASPDFVFDEIALSASKEILNQMSQNAVHAVAEFMGNSMEASDCELTLSNGDGNLPAVLGEDGDTVVTVFTYKMLIDDFIETDFMQVLSEEAVDTLKQEMEAKEQAALAEEQEKDRQAKMIHRVESEQGWAAPESVYTKYDGRADAASVMGNPYKSNIGLIMNVPLNVTVEIGRTKKKLKEVLGFDSGTVVELEKQADAPVDIIVNGQLIARGSVVVIDDNFGVRVTEIVNKMNILGNGEVS